MIKTVLFDLDGTLLNTIDDLADAGNWVCTQNGWPTFTVEQFKHMVGNGIPKLVERFSPEDARSQEQLAATLAQFSARYDAHKEDKTAPYPGIPELLAALKALRFRSCWTPCGQTASSARCFPTRPTLFVERSSTTISVLGALMLCAAAVRACPPSPTLPGCTP